jgi:hypothetical protein
MPDMNPGPMQEAGETARTAIDRLSGAPVLLTLVLVQLLTVVSVSYLSLKRQESFNEQFTALLTMCEKLGPR